MTVFVLDKHKKPLMPCSEKRARLLLDRKRAVIHKMEPFTIRLKDRTQKNSVLQPLRLKLDPGSKTTGVAITLESAEQPAKVVYLCEMKHKQGISESLTSRASLRGARRARKTRYRKPRFLNRSRKEGWLAPSLLARVQQTEQVALKLKQSLPLTHVSAEHVRFDMQKLRDPSISGKEYQQGTLFGYETREYLLEKFGRRCAYCETEHVPLEVEHYMPKSLGGTDSISNLALACRTCNEEKDNLLPAAWIDRLSRSKRRIDQVKLKNFINVGKQLTTPLKDAAAVNSTRKVLVRVLQGLFGEVELGSGGLTKFNRISRELPKEHFFDALCVGESTPGYFKYMPKYAAVWQAYGRGNRQMARVNAYGFPKGHRERKKTCQGFATGDFITANVTKGKKIGQYKGRVAIRHSGFFNIKDLATQQTVQGINAKDCRMIQRNDGWSYTKKII